MRLLPIMITSFALAASGCVAAAKQPRAVASKKAPGGKKITMDELTENDADAPAPKKGQKKVAAKPAPAKTITLPAALPAAPSGPTRADCQTQFNKHVVAYQRLYPLMPANLYQSSHSAMDRVLGAKITGCDDAATRRALMDDLAATQQSTGKIGVILPLSGTRAKLASYVVNGLRAGVREAGLDFEQLVVVRDSAGMARNAEARLAELVLKERVTAIIGGLEKAEAEALAPWASLVATPTVLLARDRDLIAKDDHLFRLYPDEKRLAETLVAGALQRGFKRIAVLRPQGGKSDKLSDHFRRTFKERGGSVIHDLLYTADNFESMSAISRTLFQTDAAARRDEYRRAYKKARDAATKQGVPFDPRMVVLKPVVDFDAVFLPDDFRTVRHFAKLFKFHMVDKLPMIGNHEWRSPALIQPFDPFLEGSLFADFIGSYAKLPHSISAPTRDSPYFVAPQNVVPVDFQLIGYRAGRVAALVAKARPADRRAARTALVEGRGDTLGSGAGTTFDADRHAAWPTFLFSVQKERINMEQDPVLPPVTHPQQAVTTKTSMGTPGQWIPRGQPPLTAKTPAPTTGGVR